MAVALALGAVFWRTFLPLFHGSRLTRSRSIQRWTPIKRGMLTMRRRGHAVAASGVLLCCATGYGYSVKREVWLRVAPRSELDQVGHSLHIAECWWER